MMAFSIIWTIGGILEDSDRSKLDDYVKSICSVEKVLPSSSLFDFFLCERSLDWITWETPLWIYPESTSNDDSLDFNSLLVPTIDTTKALYLMHLLHSNKRPILLLGQPGTSKTCTALMFCNQFLDPSKHILKRLNFSFATLPGMVQSSIEHELEKRNGKSFGPLNNKQMTLFLDDISMPEINKWNDQPTNEIVRQLIESGGFYFLDRDKRGDFKVVEDIQFIAAMTHPDSSRNDIPNRLKRHFFLINLVPPSEHSVNDMYGQMMRGRFSSPNIIKKTVPFSDEFISKSSLLLSATIKLWSVVKEKMLPTPTKFHYTFNMHDLSRIFQVLLTTPKETFLTGGKFSPSTDPIVPLIRLWKHECERVFSDKLISFAEVEWYKNQADIILKQSFGPDLFEKVNNISTMFHVNFLRDDVYDKDEVLVELSPRIYESGGSVATIKSKVEHYMEKYNKETSFKRLDLVFFDDALAHLLRINRSISLPRGSSLLVGIGGSGKQSLTKLAAFIARSRLFQISLTKTYNINSFKEDLKAMYEYAGKQRKSITLLMTDSDIRDDSFLEVLNSFLLTGDVSGLFGKDELLSIWSELTPFFIKENPKVIVSTENLRQFFIDTVRNNLHIVLCMSPVHPKFNERLHRFPGLMSSTSIDWFLPWPLEALISVAESTLRSLPLYLPEHSKNKTVNLLQETINIMGFTHSLVVDQCDLYFTQTQHRIYQTPKSYLSFLSTFTSLYSSKLDALAKKELNVRKGLDKLVQGAKDVEVMKVILAEEQTKLVKATEDTNSLLKSLTIRQKEAELESNNVAIIKTNCEAEALRISHEKSACELDLMKAQPIVERAIKAVDSIKPADINEVKKLAKPADIIRVIFDCVIILFGKTIQMPTIGNVNIKKRMFEFISPSYDVAQSIMNDANFLKLLKNFDKDSLNEETMELISPYMQMEEFDPEVAKAASKAAEGLCTWCRAMYDYYYASKLVKPKLEALTIAQSKLDEAQAALDAAIQRENQVKLVLTNLQSDFNIQMKEKQSIEVNAQLLEQKMKQASNLIESLSGEKVRWSSDAQNFQTLKENLVGDCILACAFLSYCGPFNQQFRDNLLFGILKSECKKRGISMSEEFDLNNFIVDASISSEWSLQSLPIDNLSIQNGILVTQSNRFPLLVDPQGQCLQWLQNKESKKLHREGIVPMNNPKMKEILEFCLSEGKTLIVTGIEQDIDTLFDSVLEKTYIQKNRRKFAKILDNEVEVHDDFKLFLITRVANPSFSPELQAKTLVIDFTVTVKGLEEQLLSKVISKEQNSLEKLLSQVLADAFQNSCNLIQLDLQLLDRLSNNNGNLLDDSTLLDVLENTKLKANQVKEKLISADETKASISEKRELFRPIATRGSILYFAIVSMSNINPMYQTSLMQFIDLFLLSIQTSEKSSIPSIRVNNIIDTLTYLTFRYINRSLYEQDKLLFLFLINVKLLLNSKQIQSTEILFLLKGSSLLLSSSPSSLADTKVSRPHWMSASSWDNSCTLSKSVSAFANLLESFERFEPQWKKFYEDNAPENQAIPDAGLESALFSCSKSTASWLKLLLIRALRADRLLLTIKDLISNTETLGQKYTEPITDSIESIFEESVSTIPIFFLLSVGSDPTSSLENLAKKKKQRITCVSMGEGQEPVALKALHSAVVHGTWVLLQNCELGMELMEKMEAILSSMKNSLHDDFRLFFTALPHPKFPLGLLQMCTKVTNEPPSGLRAGMLRSYNTIVDQDRFERLDVPLWRQLIFAMCFLHSSVQERRKFGSLGWNVPYEFNANDLNASLSFIEKHLISSTLSWSTIQYMISQVQYGGKVTDECDRRLLDTFAMKWLSPSVLLPEFSYAPSNPIVGKSLCVAAQYKIPNSSDLLTHKKAISEFSSVDSPEVFGLHPNADLTFRVQESRLFLENVATTQPKSSSESSSSSKSFDETLTEKANALLLSLPQDYIEDDFKAKLKKLGGLQEPLNIFLYQEIQRLQSVILKTKTLLLSVIQAIKGDIIVTNELQLSMIDIVDGKVPKVLLYTPSGDEFSWLIPSLQAWFTSMLQRDRQLRTWLNNGKPNAFWISGFANPQGFLTAMQQEVVRMHRSQMWALDDVQYQCEVTEFDRPEQVKTPPKEGVYVYGLSMEGGRWDKATGSIVEAEPKTLYASFPVLHVSTIPKIVNEDSRRANGGSLAFYQCPLYRYPCRTERYRVFTPLIPIKGTSPDHWVFRNVALLCST
jgi:dynein heavy chain, axonemal